MGTKMLAVLFYCGDKYWNGLIFLSAYNNKRAKDVGGYLTLVELIDKGIETAH